MTHLCRDPSYLPSRKNAAQASGTVPKVWVHHARPLAIQTLNCTQETLIHPQRKGLEALAAKLGLLESRRTKIRTPSIVPNVPSSFPLTSSHVSLQYPTSRVTCNNTPPCKKGSRPGYNFLDLRSTRKNNGPYDKTMCVWSVIVSKTMDLIRTSNT